MTPARGSLSSQELLEGVGRARVKAPGAGDRKTRHRGTVFVIWQRLPSNCVFYDELQIKVSQILVTSVVQMNPSVCEGSSELFQSSPGLGLGCRQADAANITLHGWNLTVGCHPTAAWCLLSVPPPLQGVTVPIRTLSTHPGCSVPVLNLPEGTKRIPESVCFEDYFLKYPCSL